MNGWIGVDSRGIPGMGVVPSIPVEGGGSDCRPSEPSTSDGAWRATPNSSGGRQAGRIDWSQRANPDASRKAVSRCVRGTRRGVRTRKLAEKYSSSQVRTVRRNWFRDPRGHRLAGMRRPLDRVPLFRRPWSRGMGAGHRAERPPGAAELRPTGSPREVDVIERGSRHAADGERDGP